MQNGIPNFDNGMAQAASALMQREMRVTFGVVPTEIDGQFFSDDYGFVVSANEFIFISLDDVRFHYCLGHGLTVQLPAAGLDTDYELFLWGTVFGTVAWLNGLVPLHASAVDVGGRVVAFTADSGGGKSTLAAALASLGLPHVCDDTLVVALQQAGAVALPDGKRLKLWDDALRMTDIKAMGAVPLMPGKSYAVPAHKATEPLPLTDLVFLERGNSIEFEPITGAAKFSMLPAALYRGFIHTARGDRALHEHFVLSFCSRVRFWRLRRPFDSNRFGSDVRAIKAALGNDLFQN